MTTNPDYFSFFPSYLLHHNFDKPIGNFLNKKTIEDAIKAEERKRRLQRERSRRYRASKVAKKQSIARTTKGTKSDDGSPLNSYKYDDFLDTLSDLDISINEYTLINLESIMDLENHSDKAMYTNKESTSQQDLSLKIRDLLSWPNQEMDYSTVHRLMFHWLQT